MKESEKVVSMNHLNQTRCLSGIDRHEGTKMNKILQSDCSSWYTEKSDSFQRIPIGPIRSG